MSGKTTDSVLMVSLMAKYSPQYVRGNTESSEIQTQCFTRENFLVSNLSCIKMSISGFFFFYQDLTSFFSSSSVFSVSLLSVNINIEMYEMFNNYNSNSLPLSSD